VTPQIHSEPLGNRRFRIDGRTTPGLRCGHQSRVVFRRRLVGVGTQDALPRPVRVAIAPGGRGGRIGADAARVPHPIELSRNIAPVVAVVHPNRLVFVEVLRAEQIQGQRRHSRRRPEDHGRRTTSPPPSAWRELDPVWRRTSIPTPTLRGHSRVILREDACGIEMNHPNERHENGKGERNHERLCSHLILPSRLFAVGTQIMYPAIAL
jgi:hypothetical protein